MKCAWLTITRFPIYSHQLGSWEHNWPGYGEDLAEFNAVNRDTENYTDTMVTANPRGKFQKKKTNSVETHNWKNMETKLCQDEVKISRSLDFTTWSRIRTADQ